MGLEATRQTEFRLELLIERLRLSLFSACMIFAANLYAGVSLTDCAIQVPIANNNMTSAYLRIEYTIDDQTLALNLPDPEALVRVEIPALSDDVQIHQSTIDDAGVMSMARLSALPLTEPETLLKPGGYHLMLTQLKQQPRLDEEYPIKLMFVFEPDRSCIARVRRMSDIMAVFKQ